MRSQYPLRAVLPDNLFPLEATVQVQTSERDEYSGQRLTTYTDLFTEKCLFTTGVRGAVRDQELRKDDRSHVRIRGNVLFNRYADIPHGSRLKIVWPANEGNKTEYWRVIGVEHRPLSNHTRCAIEQFDGTVRR